MAENKNNQFQNVVTSMFQGMEGVLSTKTVVGQPIVVGDTTLIPLVDVSFGMAAGSGANDKKDNGTGGLGGKMSPTAILVIHDGNTRLISVKNQDTLTKVIDMLPELIQKITKKKDGELSEEEIKETAFPSESSDVSKDTAEAKEEKES